MKVHYTRLLAVFASFGLGAALVQGVHAQTKPPVYENPIGLFRVVIVVHAISSDWHETFGVNPEYPSFETCEAARADLVEDFLQILKRRYLQPFTVDSKCANQRWRRMTCAAVPLIAREFSSNENWRVIVENKAATGGNRVLGHIVAADDRTDPFRSYHTGCGGAGLLAAHMPFPSDFAAAFRSTSWIDEHS